MTPPSLPRPPVSQADREAVYRILAEALGPYWRPVPCLPDEYRIKPEGKA